MSTSDCKLPHQRGRVESSPAASSASACCAMMAERAVSKPEPRSARRIRATMHCVRLLDQLEKIFGDVSVRVSPLRTRRTRSLRRSCAFRSGCRPAVQPTRCRREGGDASRHHLRRADRQFSGLVLVQGVHRRADHRSSRPRRTGMCVNQRPA